MWQETNAGVAELADALDSKSSGLNNRVGSSPTFGTIDIKGFAGFPVKPIFVLFCSKKQLVTGFCDIEALNQTKQNIERAKKIAQVGEKSTRAIFYLSILSRRGRLVVLGR